MDIKLIGLNLFIQKELKSGNLNQFIVAIFIKKLKLIGLDDWVYNGRFVIQEIIMLIVSGFI